MKKISIETKITNRVLEVRHWINSKPWDKHPRLQKVLDSVVCDKTQMHENVKNSIISGFMKDAVAAALRYDYDKFKLRGSGFQSIFGKQGIGKTTFLRNLVGADWGGNKLWFGEGFRLNPNSKNDVLEAQKYWIVELAELPVSEKKLLEIKQFLIKPSNKISLTKTKEIEIWNRTVYMATTNEERFLSEIPVVKFEDISHIDMQQVWAEVKWDLIGGASYDNG